MKTTTLSTTIAATLALSALVGACSKEADNCRNTNTCPPASEAGSSAGGETSSGGATSNRGGANVGGTSVGGTSVGGSTSGGGESSGGTSSTTSAATTTAPCNGTCSGSTPVCKPATNACVECTGNGDCKDSTKPLCDTSANKCVACLQGTDCKDTAKPVCNSASQSCVACAANSDCKDAAASRCDVSTNTCTSCAIDSDCTQVSGKNVCMVGATGQANQCVQCTGKKYSACGQSSDGKALVCDSAKYTCSTTATMQSADVCQPCISDSQCLPGRYCLQQTFGGRNAGNFCFWKQGDPAGGAPTACFSTANRPYVQAQAGISSLDGDGGTYCMLATTTCKAIADYRTTDCATTGSPANNVCGFAPGQDSKCAETSTGSGTFRCTTACLSNDDCPGISGTTSVTCAQSGTQKYCTL